MNRLNAETPTAATVSASKVHWNPVQGILAHVRMLVNPVRLYRELVAARSLIAAYEATAERQKGGQR